MKDISERLTIQEHNRSQIIFVDYTGLKENEMIDLVNQHLALTLKTKLNFLADFHDTFATPGYMVHGRRFVETTKDIVDRGAFLGIDPVKAWILRGILSDYPVNYKSFESVDEAIAFLTNAKSP